MPEAPTGYPFDDTEREGTRVDCLELLIADHNRFRGLFSRYQEASEGPDTERMAAIAERLFSDLDIHAKVEEEVFYPAVRDLTEDLAEHVEEGIQEHHVGDVLMAEMKELEAGDDEWNAKMEVLVESMEHHLDEEEEQLFPSVRSHTDAAFREDLGLRMDAHRAGLGFPTVQEREKLSAEELRKLAQEQEIHGRSQMNKQELAAAVDTR